MSIIRSLSRPDEISALIKLKFGSKSTSGNDITTTCDEDLKYCFDTLDAVSRSFATVIRQLPEELSINICLFYLVLRALDSIEDDMSCPKDVKVKLLREFHTYNYKTHWNITDVGDKEEYRELLANYDKVIRAFSKVDKKYQDIITDICLKMGEGMANFIEKDINSVEDYDTYCHYVAGLVGIGLSKIFAASGLEDNNLKFQDTLSNSMGLFLQKTNIIRDYKEDLEETRTFWPKAIWNSYAETLDYFSSHAKEQHSISCLNHMVNDALNHVTDCLEYLKKIKTKGIFKFCAIPQVMAIATLCEVYNNPKVFLKNVKIRKGFAAKLIVNTNSYYDVISIFEDIINVFEHKIPKQDPTAQETLKIIESIKSYFRDEQKSPLKIA